MKKLTKTNTAEEVIAKTITLLSPISEEPRLEAQLLLAHTLAKPRIWLVAHATDPINNASVTKLNYLITMRLHHKPLAYIIGKKEFYGLNFYVNQNVLIPRPETEFLIDYVLHFATTYDLPTIRRKALLTTFCILDIGTGSGCIAITLAKHLPTAKIIATDISKEALVIAKKNAMLHHVSDQIMFLEGNLLDPLDNGVNIDILIANLPYIPSDRMKILEPGIKDWEPKRALDGGKDGMDFYQQLEDQITQLPKKPDLTVYEIDHTQFATFRDRGFTVFEDNLLAVRE